MKNSERYTAVIVGGCSGIGAGMALSLAEDHDLILVYRQNQVRAESFLKQLNTQFTETRVCLIQTSLETEKDVQALFNNVTKLCPKGPQILINSFGERTDQMFVAQTLEKIETTITQHLVLPTLLCRLAFEHMYRNSFGRIINVGSISDRYVKRGMVAYSAAKAGLEGLTRALALEGANKNITVNLIRPGLIATPSTFSHLQKLEQAGKPIRNFVPIGHWGEPEDVGALVRYLCSDQARYVTGSSFTIDGGRSLGDVTL